MSVLNDEARAQMHAINSNLSHTRRTTSGARYFSYDKEKGKVVEQKRSNQAIPHTMFPVWSSAMAVPPEEIPAAKEMLRQRGIFAEFNEEGQIRIDSFKQQSDLAKAFELKTGRDGYGHLDENGNFQNSGRRRADEVREGRKRVRKTIELLNTMPEEVPLETLENALGDY